MFAGLCRANLRPEYSIKRKKRKPKYVFGKHNASKREVKCSGLKYKITSESESSDDGEEGIYIANDNHLMNENDKTALIRRSFAKGTTENPAYGISSHWPYYCDCCSCCCESDCDTDSDIDSESLCSTTSEESLNISTTSLSSTSSDEDSKYLKPYKKLSNTSPKNYKHAGSELIHLDLTDKRLPDLTISTQLKTKDGNSERIELQISNIQFDDNSVITLKRSNSLTSSNNSKFSSKRVSGRRKADSWAGDSINSNETSPCRGRREQKKQLLAMIKDEKEAPIVPENLTYLSRLEELQKRENTLKEDDTKEISIPDSSHNSETEQKDEIKQNTIALSTYSLEKLTIDNRVGYFGDLETGKAIPAKDDDVDEDSRSIKHLKNSSYPSNNRLTRRKNVEAENIDKLLSEGSENDPANIPMVVMQSCQLDLILNPASRDTITVPMGTIVNALYKYDDNLRVKTPHGDEGLLKYYNCAPLVSLPTARRTLDRIRLPANVKIPVIKPKILDAKSNKNASPLRQFSTPNIPKSKLLKNKMEKLKNWEEKASNQSENTTASEPPDKGKYSRMVMTEGPIVSVICSYKSRGKNNLSVDKGDYVTILNQDLSDWIWVRASSGAQGFIPNSHVSTIAHQNC